MEQEYGYGLVPSPYDVRDYILSSTAADYSNLPEEFYLGTLLIKNQGPRPTCVAHTISELIEYHNYNQNNKQFDRFSTEFIYGAREPDYYMGDGMYLREALKIAQKRGDVLYEDLPGNHDVQEAMQNVWTNQNKLFGKAYPNRISTYYRITTNNQLKYALYHNGPVPIGIMLYDGYYLNKNNVLCYNKNDNVFGHAVLVVGWTKDYWIIQNSWGKMWGDEGKFYIPKTNFWDICYEAYGVTDNINEIKPAGKCADFFHPIINWFMNLIRKK